MAVFEGTIDEFTKFIGAYARNKVLHITSKYRKQIGKCEECGIKENLDAAHIKGKERRFLISNILNEFIENEIVNVNLDEFEEKFIEAHKPIKQVIKILCKECHRKYDSTKDIHEITPEEKHTEDVEEIKKFEKEENEVIEELVVNALMNKTKAINLVNERSPIRSLNNNNTIFSNVNSSANVWWLEPSNDKFKTDLNFILNDSIDRILYHIYLPAEKIVSPEKLFYQRNDRDYSKIFIPVSAYQFVDKKGFDFGKFLIDKIEY